jgi:hypothetical protein
MAKSIEDSIDFGAKSGGETQDEENAVCVPLPAGRLFFPR